VNDELRHDEYRDDPNRPDPNRMEELAARARELAARAEEMSRQASTAAESESELAALERELADLDAEERKLDAEFTALLEDGGTQEETASEEPKGRDDDRARTREERLTSWADRLAENMDSLGDRLTEMFNSAFSSGSFGGFGASGKWADRIEREVTVGGPLPVTIDNAAGGGRIVVHVGADDAVRVLAERRGAAVAERGDATVDVVLDDDGVRVTCEPPSNAGFGPGWVNLDVAVPRTSTVTASTKGGPIVVDHIGGAISASTKGGSIRVAGARGSADVKTLGGSIVVADHDGPVEAHTMGGSIKLTGHLADEVVAETAGGSISVFGVDGRVVAGTTGGSVRASGRFTGNSSLTTHGGSVSAKVAPDSDVTVDGHGNSAASDIDALRVSKGRIEGTLGDGSGGTLYLRTTAGSVRVQRLSTSG
jgi:hypothetical protein